MNLAAAVRASAVAQGERTALVGLSVDAPPQSVTYAELDDLIQRAAVGYRRAGVTAGDRVLVAVTPGVDLYVAVFGALCVGATAVFLDAQAARTTQVRALAAAAPAAVVAPAKLLRAAPIVPALRRTRLRVAIGGGAPGAVPMSELVAGPRAATPICAERRDDDVAFVTYTSGSTGRPKGVPRTHGLLRRQHEAIQANFPMSPDEVALVGFPMLGVHTLLVGCTAVLVPFDPRFDTDALARALRRHAITSVGLGPAMWRDLLPVLAASTEPVPELRYVGTGGAPLSLGVARAIHEQFPTATCYSAYGSAEAEPVARIELGRFIDAATAALDPDAATETPGGYPVGAPVPEVRVRVVPVGALDPERRGAGPTDVEGAAVGPGEVGEIVLCGPNVVDRYVGDPDATAATKVADPTGAVWHRTGDVGWFDASGCLWLVGRVADRIVGPDGGVVDPYPLELALDELPAVRRAAVIAHSARPTGEVIVEERPGETVDVVAVARLLQRHGLELPIVRAAIPLDTRIRSKIDRSRLRRHRVELLAGGGPTWAGRVVSKGRREGRVVQSGERWTNVGEGWSASGGSVASLAPLAERLDVDVLRYGRVWEDEALLAAALDVGPDDDVLSIASAGDNSLALLAAGARSVTAVDLSPAQLALVDLHRAAIDALGVADHEVLVGLAPESAVSRSALFARVAGRLEPTSRHWFDRHADLLEAGLVPAGRLDAYFGRFQAVVADLIGPDRLHDLLHLDAAAVADGRAAELVDSLLDEPRFTAWFADWFGRASMERHGRDPEQLRHVDGEVGPTFLARFAAHLRGVPTVDNPYAWRFLTGADGPGAAGLALRDPTRRALLRDRLDRLRLVRGDFAALLAEAPVAAWSAVNCSDLFEYLDPGATERIFGLLAERVRPGGRVAWWNLLVERVPSPGLGSLLVARPSDAAALPVERTWFYAAFHVRHRAADAGAPGSSWGAGA